MGRPAVTTSARGEPRGSHFDGSGRDRKQLCRQADASVLVHARRPRLKPALRRLSDRLSAVFHQHAALPLPCDNLSGTPARRLGLHVRLP